MRPNKIFIFIVFYDCVPNFFVNFAAQTCEPLKTDGEKSNRTNNRVDGIQRHEHNDFG